MAKKDLPDETIIEVVLSKEMRYSEYKKLISKPNKGWRIEAFQKDFRK